MSQDPDHKSDTNNNSTGGNQEGPKDLICRDYQRGVCTRGSKCKFKHPDGMGTELTNSPMICRDFQNGKCNRSTCKYLHLSNNEEKVYLRTGQMPPRRGAPDPLMHFRGEPTRAGPSDPVCKDFLNRKCSRGQGCRYRHVLEDEGGDFSSYDAHPNKRRRESYEGQSFYYLMDENEALRRKVSELQKQVADLKATNEVLLEQNARYRNQAGERPPYNGTSNTARPSDYSPGYSGGYSAGASAGTSQSYSTSYPPRESYASKDTYTSTPRSYSSNESFGGTAAYTSNTAYGTGYTKFD